MAELVVETSRDHPDALRVAGELDLATVDQFSARVSGALDTAGTALVLDFGGVTFVDSTGLGSLVRLQDEARKRGKSLDLVQVGRQVRRVLDLTGLSSMFPAEEL